MGVWMLVKQRLLCSLNVINELLKSDQVNPDHGKAMGFKRIKTDFLMAVSYDWNF
jgi:hypothetical protein